MSRTSTLTVLVTDAVSGTAFRHSAGDLDAHERMVAMDGAVREIAEGRDGRVVKGTGDGLLIVFDSARAALLAAVDTMRSVHLREPGQRPGIRAGLHTGEAIRDGDDVFGVTVDAAFRINSRAAGGQILVSEMVRGVLGGANDFVFRDHGHHELKGFPEAWRLYEVPWNPSDDWREEEGSWAFLFCDMIGSTEAAAELDERGTFVMMRSITAILRNAAAFEQARAVESFGDGGLAVFDSVDAAVRCGVRIQEACKQYGESGGRSIPMRVSIHFGEGFHEAGKFYARALFVGARVVDVARAGEMLLTDEALRELAPGAAALGEARLEALRPSMGTRTVHPVLWETD